MFANQYECIGFMLSEILTSLMEKCVSPDNEILARIGVTCIYQLIVECGSKFDDIAWDISLGCLERLVKKTMPEELLLAKEQLQVQSLSLSHLLLL